MIPSAPASHDTGLQQKNLYTTVLTSTISILAHVQRSHSLCMIHTSCMCLEPTQIAPAWQRMNMTPNQWTTTHLLTSVMSGIWLLVTSVKKSICWDSRLPSTPKGVYF